MIKSLKVWLQYTINSFQITAVNKLAFGFLLVGKIVRIILFLVFLNFIFSGAKSLAGYSKEQIIFFYLSFNLIETLGQLFFREVYRFRELVISGNLDMVLVKPVNPLIRVLLGGTDPLDFLVLGLLIFATLSYGTANISTNPLFWLLFIFLVINGLIITAAFYIFVLCMGILTTSVDHLVMVYRDMTSMLRIPVDLYIEPIRFLLTFAIPLGIMLTFPPKALMGLLSPQMVLISLLASIFSILISLKFWRYALSKYQSASS